VERLFAVDVATGRTDPPPEMEAWLVSHFGSVAAVREQTIVRVTNRWSLEGTLFSTLRSRRPVEGGRNGALAAEVEATRGGPFCHPERDTPADTWGRVRTAHAVTGANAAMYDGQHAVIVLDDHDPLAFDEGIVHEVLGIGRQWADRAREADPGAVNYLLIWNCGWRAGGSVVHGHAQVLLGRGAHYPKVERLRRDAQAYAAAAGGAYLADLLAAHRDLGLVVAEAGGVAVVASLTPVKEHELLVIGPPGMDEREPAFADLLARTLVAYRDEVGVRAFNLALHRPPLEVHEGEDWSAIGPVVHLVDRGDPGSRASDIGGMELYAASVVGSDPFELAARLRGTLATS
jgi:galactose-1-phosphate uridylyltransferase